MEGKTQVEDTTEGGESMKFASLFIQAAKSNPSAKVAGMILESRCRHIKEIKAKGR